MNLTPDEMDVLNFRLTEIALELLGNSFYNIYGQKCESLGSLYRSKTGPTDNEFAANSDLIKALNMEDVFIDRKPHNSNFVASSYMEESEDEADGQTLQRGLNQTISKILFDVETEHTRMLMNSEKKKVKHFITHRQRMENSVYDKYEICNQYHAEENERLMGHSDAFIKLIKYIKCDTRNELKMGELAANILRVKDYLTTMENKI